MTPIVERLARAAKVEGDITRRIERYERALLVLLLRHEGPPTAEDHTTALQLVDLVAAFEHELRHPRAEPAPEPPAPIAAPATRRPRRRRARRAAAATDAPRRPGRPRKVPPTGLEIPGA